MDIYIEAINLVAKGLIDQAIAFCTEVFITESESTLYKDLILIESRIKQLEREEKLGISDTSTVTIEKNKIANALLILINKIQKDNTSINYSTEGGLKLFLSYSHRDIISKKRLDKHLEPLKRNGLIEVLSDDEILPGQNWENIVDKNFNDADIILLLISGDMITSEYLYSEEIYNAIEKHKKGEIALIPILLKPCEWERTPVADITMLPSNGKPISSFSNDDDAYISISTSLQNIIKYRFEESKKIRSIIKKLENELVGDTEDYNQVEKVEALIDYYKSINKQKKVDEYSEIRDRMKFRFNVENPILIKRLNIDGVSIYNEVNWNVQPNINIILGRNGYGKSHLLRLIPCLLRNEKKILDVEYKLYNTSLLKLEINQGGEFKFTYYDDCKFTADVGIVPMLAIPAIRNLTPSKVLTGVKDQFHGELCEIGALHFINQVPFDSLIQDKLFVLGKEILKEYGSEPLLNKERKLPIVELINEVVKELTSNTFEIVNVKDFFGQSHIDVEVLTEGNKEPIKIQKVSQGTISILSILILIYYYIKSLYPTANEKDLFAKEAIVLIDEIDAHLHPVWQKKIIGILRKNFPKVQFFITAHSPFIVAGCLEREVSVLRKVENGKFSLYQFNAHFIGSDLQEIYSRVFEIENIEDETFIELSIENSHLEESAIIDRIDNLENTEDVTNSQAEELANLHRLLQVREISIRREENNYNEVIDGLKAKVRMLEEKILEFKS